MFAVTEFFCPEDEQNLVKVFEEKEEAFAYAREQAKEAYEEEISGLSDPDDVQIEFTEGVDSLNIRLQIYGGLMAWIWSAQKIK